LENGTIWGVGEIDSKLPGQQALSETAGIVPSSQMGDNLWERTLIRSQAAVRIVSIVLPAMVSMIQ
jgi:hypothetical protein